MQESPSFILALSANEHFSLTAGSALNVRAACLQKKKKDLDTLREHVTNVHVVLGCKQAQREAPLCKYFGTDLKHTGSLWAPSRGISIEHNSVRVALKMYSMHVQIKEGEIHAFYLTSVTMTGQKGEIKPVFPNWS